VVVAQGQSSVSYSVRGVAASADSVAVTATAGRSRQTAQCTVNTPVLALFDVDTTRSTFSQPLSIRGFVLNPACQFCGDVLSNSLTVTFAAFDPNTSAPSDIVTISPSQVTIPAGANSTSS